jgi:carbon monoxide dehydrogenase subunit G
MRLENSFEVPASEQTAWDLLMDVPRVIPCMPGAELVEAVGDTEWKARVRVRLGPISLTFLADVRREEVDEAARRVRLVSSAREERGRGTADATIESWLGTAADGRTRVDVVTDLTLTGPLTQYGRGVVPDVAAQLVRSFAGCLEQQLAAPPVEEEVAAAADTPPEPAAPAPPPAPAPGLAIGIRALWSAFLRFLRRLVGRRRG